MNIQDSWKKIKLKSVLNYEQPNKYIVTTPIISDENLIPVLTANKSFIKGYTIEKENIYTDLPVIIFDDFTADNKYVNFPFKVKSSAMKFLRPNNSSIYLKYVFYQMQLNSVNTSTHKRYYLSIYQNNEFIFPIDKNNQIDLKKQQKIVEEIEKQFTKLDIVVGDLQKIKIKLETYRKAILKTEFVKNVNWEKKFFSNCFKNITPIEKINKSNYLVGGKYPIVDQGEKLIGGYLNEKKPQTINLPVIIFGDHTRRFKFIDFDFVAGADGIKILEPEESFIPKFLYYQCLVLDFPNKGYSRHYQYLKKLEIRYPISKTEQRGVVRNIESKFSVINKLEDTADRALAKVELLRKSILKKAFSGELIK